MTAPAAILPHKALSPDKNLVLKKQTPKSVIIDTIYISEKGKQKSLEVNIQVYHY